METFFNSIKYAWRLSQRRKLLSLENTISIEDAAGFNPDAQYNLTDRGEPEEIPSNICQGNLFNVLGVDGPPMQFASQAIRAVTTVDGDQSTYDMKTMQHRIDDRLWQDKVIGHVLILFLLQR